MLPALIRHEELRIGNDLSMDRSKTKRALVGVASLGALGLLIGLIWVPGLRAQTPEEHASHHPGQASGAAPAVGPMPAADGGRGPDGMGPPGGGGGMGHE